MMSSQALFKATQKSTVIKSRQRERGLPTYAESERQVQQAQQAALANPPPAYCDVG